MAYAGIKEPEVGIFEAVFSPPDYFSSSFALCLRRLQLHPEQVRRRRRTFLAGIRQKKACIRQNGLANFGPCQRVLFIQFFRHFCVDDMSDVVQRRQEPHRQLREL